MDKSTNGYQKLLTSDYLSLDSSRQIITDAQQKNEEKKRIEDYERIYFKNDVIYWICSKYKKEKVFTDLDLPVDKVVNLLLNLWNYHLNSLPITRNLIQELAFLIFEIKFEDSTLMGMEEVYNSFQNDMSELRNLHKMKVEEQKTFFLLVKDEELGIFLTESNRLDRSYKSKARVIVEKMKSVNITLLNKKKSNEKVKFLEILIK